MGMRAGFVHKTEDDIIRTLQPGRPLSAYSVPFNYTDIGLDGRRGTADDSIIPMLGFPNSQVNFARTVAISAPAGLTATGTGYAEPVNSNREDNIWVFDIRAERTITLGSRMRIRAYLDAFNLTNSHASETTSRATGLGYQQPSAILHRAPRGSDSGSSSETS